MVSMQKIFKTILGLLFAQHAISQAQFSGTGVFTQSFGTSVVNSWTNNSTFKGWYMSTGTCDYQGTENITTAAPSDAGGLYTYQSNGSGQILIGFRPSDTKPGGPCGGGSCAWDGSTATTNSYTCYIGLRLKNYSTLAIKSMQISFDWYQLSLAPNGSTVNTDYVDYQVGSTETNPSSGNWTEIPALEFTAPKSTASCCSNQINGYPWSGAGANPQKSSVSTLVTLNVPAGDEIMIRWSDPNNSNDDPHMGFGNITIDAFSDAGGTVPLPISLLDFEAQYNQQSHTVDIYWVTASETNNKSFTIEKTIDGNNWETVAVIDGAGTINRSIRYTTTDESPYTGISYYRLKQTDFDGDDHYPGGPVPVEISNYDLRGVTVSPNPAGKNAVINFYTPNSGNANLTIYNSTGQAIDNKEVVMAKGTTTTELNVSDYKDGMYYVVINNGLTQLSSKFVVNHNVH